MSHTLHTADNISVKGDHYITKMYSDTDTTSDGVDTHAIHLDFTLLINWKLKTFGWSFIIEDWKEHGHDWTLSYWSDWNAIYFTLANLWYPIDDREEGFWQGTLHKWIRNIMSNV